MRRPAGLAKYIGNREPGLSQFLQALSYSRHMYHPELWSDLKVHDFAGVTQDLIQMYSMAQGKSVIHLFRNTVSRVQPHNSSKLKCSLSFSSPGSGPSSCSSDPHKTKESCLQCGGGSSSVLSRGIQHPHLRGCELITAHPHTQLCPALFCWAVIGFQSAVDFFSSQRAPRCFTPSSVYHIPHQRLHQALQHMSGQ